MCVTLATANITYMTSNDVLDAGRRRVYSPFARGRGVTRPAPAARGGTMRRVHPALVPLALVVGLLACAAPAAPAPAAAPSPVGAAASGAPPAAAAAPTSAPTARPAPVSLKVG